MSTPPAMHRCPRNVALASAESIRRDLVEAAATLYRLDVARWALRVSGRPMDDEVRDGRRAMRDIASALAVDFAVEVEELIKLGMRDAASDLEKRVEGEIAARCPGPIDGPVPPPTLASLFRRGMTRRTAG